MNDNNGIALAISTIRELLRQMPSLASVEFLSDCVRFEVSATARAQGYSRNFSIPYSLMLDTSPESPTTLIMHGYDKACEDIRAAIRQDWNLI